MMEVGVGRPEFVSLKGKYIFVFSSSTPSPCPKGREDYSPMIKRPECEADHTPPSSPEID
jgi:hypothetical protein